VKNLLTVGTDCSRYVAPAGIVAAALLGAMAAPGVVGAGPTRNN